jgi:hypothetical protein
LSRVARDVLDLSIDPIAAVSRKDKSKSRVKGVQEFLRHSQIGTTADIYVHQRLTVGRKASELLASELDRAVVESELVMRAS